MGPLHSGRDVQYRSPKNRLLTYQSLRLIRVFGLDRTRLGSDFGFLDPPQKAGLSVPSLSSSPA